MIKANLKAMTLFPRIADRRSINRLQTRDRTTSLFVSHQYGVKLSLAGGTKHEGTQNLSA